MINRTLDRRYGVCHRSPFVRILDGTDAYLFSSAKRLTEFFFKPYSKMLIDHPHMAHSQPFELRLLLYACIGVNEETDTCLIAFKSNPWNLHMALKKSCTSTFQDSNTTVMGLFIPVHSHPTSWVRIQKCESTKNDGMAIDSFFFAFILNFYLFKSQMETSLRK